MCASAGPKLCQSFAVAMQLDMELPEARGRSLRWTVAGVLSGAALLSLLVFLPSTDGSLPRGSVRGVISESNSLQIEGVDSEKSKAAMKSMQQGFASLGSMLGMGLTGEKGKKAESVAAAKESMKKAEGAMMNMFKDLQQQSAANGKQGILAKLNEQKAAHKELLKKYKAAGPEEKKKMTQEYKEKLQKAQKAANAKLSKTLQSLGNMEIPGALLKQT